MPRRVFVHVGLPKTGTSSIQHSLQLSRRELASLDYGVPGSTWLAQREAVWDLLGRRVGGAEGGGVPGSWQRLVKEIRRSTDSAQLVSEELLVHARPRHARRIAQELEPFELNVVVTVRDLTTAVPSMWQQEVLTGATWTWRDYVDAVADPERGAPTAGVAFWLRLATWTGSSTRGPRCAPGEPAPHRRRSAGRCLGGAAGPLWGGGGTSGRGAARSASAAERVARPRGHRADPAPQPSAAGRDARAGPVAAGDPGPPTCATQRRPLSGRAGLAIPDGTSKPSSAAPRPRSPR